MAAPKKVEKKPTEYVVLRSDETQGPFTVVGNFTTHGQIAAKKAAAIAHMDENPEASFFVAVPASSFYPQKPVVQMTITFLADDGNEAEEPEEEPEEELEAEPAVEEEPEDDGLPFNGVEGDEPEDDDLGGLK